MKLVIKKIALVLLVASLFLACNKEGTQGITGNTGPVGAIGPAGKNGIQLLAGIGLPNRNIGNNGDYYLDKQTWNLYGPKTSNRWGKPFTFSGNHNGIILSGNGIPDTAAGTAGDFYLDTTGYLLYGPKLTINNWGPALMLKGTGGSSGVRAYVITNPYIYFVDYNAFSNPDSHDYGLSVPYDPFIKFDLWSAVSNNNEVVTYFKRRYIPYHGTREIEEMVNANGILEVPNGDYASDINYRQGSHYIVGENTLDIHFYNSFGMDRISKGNNEYLRGDWTNKAGFESLTAIKSILIFVISSSAISNLKFGIGRIRNPENSKAIEQLLKPYLNNF